MSDEVAVVAQPKVDIAMSDKGALMPRSLDQIWRIANMVIASGLAPKAFKTKEQVVLAIAHGAEIGLPPLQALQSLAVVNGKVSMYGDALLAKAWPVLESWDEWYEDGQGIIDQSKAGWGTRIEQALKTGSLVAVSKGKRKGQAGFVVESFSVDDAKRAKLWGKEGPWQTYPARQMRWRARGWALRTLAPDILGGLISREEAVDEPRTPEYEVTAARGETVHAENPMAALTAKLEAKNTETFDATDAPIEVPIEPHSDELEESDADGLGKLNF